jgi:hypothetical protein
MRRRSMPASWMSSAKATIAPMTIRAMLEPMRMSHSFR